MYIYIIHTILICQKCVCGCIYDTYMFACMIPMLHPQIVSNCWFSSSYRYSRYYPALWRSSSGRRSLNISARHGIYMLEQCPISSHYTIYYNIIPLLLDISYIYIYIYISHYYQYPQSWDDHLNMNGMFKSYNPINKSHDFTMILHQLLVGGAITILKNMTSSMGRMTSHILWNIKNDWNHQPD